MNIEDNDIMDSIEEGEFFDNLSKAYCDVCGARLTVNEYEEWESFCEECMFEETSGLIDDVVEEELD